MDEIFYCSAYLYSDMRCDLDRDIGVIMASLKQCVDTLFDDWWFTSLWTLQEGILRPDAIILSRDAQTVGHHFGPPPPPSSSMSVVRTGTVELRFLSNALWNLRFVLESAALRFTEPPLSQLGDAIVERIKCAGYSTLPSGFNPNIQWGATRFRNASMEQDRIYGIMSIYNLRVGAAAVNAAASSPLRYSLADLERELAMALNQTSPLLGQMFIHLTKPVSTGTWQMSQRITVPSDFCHYETHYSSTCDVTINTTT